MTTTNHVNGDIPTPPINSAFLQHLLRYPVISDGVESFKQNEYGQRSLRLGDSAYKTFGAPVVSLLQRPMQYVEPYFRRVDDMGDQTLSRVDERFPAMKKPTGELYAGAKNVILLPYQKGLEGRDHVVGVYSTELKKNGGGDGLVLYARSAISAGMVVGSELLVMVGDFWSTGKERTSEKMSNGARE